MHDPASQGIHIYMTSTSEWHAAVLARDSVWAAVAAEDEGSRRQAAAETRAAAAGPAAGGR